MNALIQRSRSVAVTLTATAIAIITLTLGAFAVGVAEFNHDLMEKKIIAQIQQQTRLVKSMLISFDQSLGDETQRLMRTLASHFDATFSLKPAEMIRVKGLATPALYSGGEPLNLNTQELERFTGSTTAAATIFVRIDDGFVRVATTLLNEQGERAIGSALASGHPALPELLAGKDYVGRATLFGKEFMTAYRPLLDSQGNVIGALFVGLDVSASVARIKKEITSMKIGDTGYYYALDAKPGKDLGRLMVHPTKEGSNILDARDADGHEFIKEILERKQGVIHYPWINKESGETSSRLKVVAYDYFPAWQWVIAGGAYDDELSRDSALLRNITLGVAVGVVLILGLALFSLSRHLIARPLQRATAVFANIGAGRYDNPVEADRQDEIGALFRSLGHMQTSLDQRTRADAAVAAESFRIRRALEKASTNMMVSDKDGTIIYMNEAVTQMMRAAEADMRKDLPNFRADRLLGSSFDEFHRHPAHQRQMLAALQNTHTAQIRIGGRTFRLVANPVIDETGERLGSVVEWTDRTGEVETENELAALLEAALKGDFTHRLPLEGKSGFFRDLSDGMNRLVGIVSSGLADIARVLDSIAMGDLTKRIDADYEGAFGQMKDATNLTVARLREVVSRIKESTDTINTAAGEISSGNSDLSSRTETQASSLEETASAMEELNATVRQNAENAAQANRLAASSNAMATRGGEMVQSVVDTMGAIQGSSRKIADIISVIDGIAFQTNILALNAAVEAARAGEQGKGFAVVAAEVRNLAQRSAQAAKEIKELIDESVRQVDGGAKLVEDAGQTMGEIVLSFQQVATLVTEIAAASREQSSGIEQVSLAVAQMDEVTQQNAALVEEAAAAAESLEDQARALAKAVSTFKLDEAGRQRAAPGAADWGERRTAA